VIDSWMMRDETRLRRMDLRWPVDPATSRRKCAVFGMSTIGNVVSIRRHQRMQTAQAVET
jgi:hypothetical protein